MTAPGIEGTGAAEAPIVVVGGGVAGLVCARRLQRLGHAVLLLEGEPEVGGRVRSTVRDGLVLDHGFQVLFTAYPVLGAELELAALQPQRCAPAAWVVRDGRARLLGDALRDPALLWPVLRDGGMGWGDLLRMLRLRLLAASQSVEGCFAPRFARHDTASFLRWRGFSPQAIAGFFAPFYGGILLDPSLGASASVLLFTLKMLAQGDTVLPAAGMGAITQQLARGLRPGTVRCAARVAAVTVEGDGAGGRRATGVVLASGERVAARAVVLATDPWSRVPLAATAGIALAEPPAPLGCTTVYFTAPRAPLPGKSLWLNATPGAVVSHALTVTEVAPGYAPAGTSLLAATAVGASAQLEEDVLVAAARREVAAMAQAGGVAPAPLTPVATWRVPRAQFMQPPGWMDQRPGLSGGRGIASGSDVTGVWLASELEHSSSLDGAARGGVAAAEAVQEAVRAGRC
jgi:glycine/D-amino acid oxidase-like deaminating enzyme